MGDDLLEKTINNRNGYFESKSLVDLNEKILRDWKNPVDPTVSFHDYRGEYFELLKTYKEHEIWGMKDPRLCFTLKYFIDSIPNVYILATKRKISESTQSLYDARNRIGDTITLKESEKIQLRYEFAKQKILDQHRHMTIDYNSLLSDPRIVSDIASYCHIESDLKLAIASVNPNLRTVHDNRGISR